MCTLAKPKSDWKISMTNSRRIVSHRRFLKSLAKETTSNCASMFDRNPDRSSLSRSKNLMCNRDVAAAPGFAAEKFLPTKFWSRTLLFKCKQAANLPFLQTPVKESLILSILWQADALRWKSQQLFPDNLEGALQSTRVSETTWCSSTSVPWSKTLTTIWS